MEHEDSSELEEFEHLIPVQPPTSPGPVRSCRTLGRMELEAEVVARIHFVTGDLPAEFEL
jgi:hypothetical protein